MMKLGFSKPYIINHFVHAWAHVCTQVVMMISVYLTHNGRLHMSVVQFPHHHICTHEQRQLHIRGCEPPHKLRPPPQSRIGGPRLQLCRCGHLTGHRLRSHLLFSADLDCMKGSTVDAMSEAVDAAEVMLFGVSGECEFGGATPSPGALFLQ